MPDKNKPRSIIIGAGWAGLACAYKLCQAGHQITLLEAAPQIGGRARTIISDGIQLDNGQHVMLGAYHHTKAIIKELSLDQNQLFQTIPLEIFAHAYKTLHIKLARLKSPWHIIVGILTAKNLSLRDKFLLLKFCYKLHATDFKLQEDCSIAELLSNYHQSKFLIKAFWEPLALAVMTTPIANASAQVFLNVLKLSFGSKHSDSDWLLPKTDLSALLPLNIASFITKHHGAINCNQAVTSLNITGDRCLSIRTKDQLWQADNFIIALPPWRAMQLLGNEPSLLSLKNKLALCTFEAITTIYYIFSSPVNLDYPIYGHTNGLAQWIFDRAFCNQPNILSVVISGNGKHLALSNQELTAQVLEELQAEIPTLKNPINFKVIREKRAAFSCTTNIHAQRPTYHTPINNLWLTGDYIQNNLPATLEGAVMNGLKVADLVLLEAKHGGEYIASL